LREAANVAVDYANKKTQSEAEYAGFANAVQDKLQQKEITEEQLVQSLQQAQNRLNELQNVAENIYQDKQNLEQARNILSYHNTDLQRKQEELTALVRMLQREKSELKRKNQIVAVMRGRDMDRLQNQLDQAQIELEELRQRGPEVRDRMRRSDTFYNHLGQAVTFLRDIQMVNGQVVFDFMERAFYERAGAPSAPRSGRQMYLSLAERNRLVEIRQRQLQPRGVAEGRRAQQRGLRRPAALLDVQQRVDTARQARGELVPVRRVGQLTGARGQRLRALQQERILALPPSGGRRFDFPMVDFSARRSQ
jgi:DNA repair exonuclease SbcCD ATPase subunit